MTQIVEGRGEILGLTGMRGFAALLVLAYHAPWLADLRSAPGWGVAWWHRLLDASDAGVGLFFILSGFLLSLPYWRGVASGSRMPCLQKYFIHRAARILPGYWIALFVYQYGHDRTWTGQGIAVFVAAFLGLDSWLHLGWEYRNHPVLWTVSVEMMFYLILPFIFIPLSIFIGKYNWTAKDRILAALIAVLCVSSLAGPTYETVTERLAAHLPHFFLGDGKDSPAVSQSAFHYLSWFGIGVSAGWIRMMLEANRIKLIRKQSTLLFILGGIWVVATLLLGKEGEWRQRNILHFAAWPCGVIGFALLVVVVPYSKLALNFFDSWVMKILGELSYGIYLWHVPVFRGVYDGSVGKYFTGEAKLWIGGGIGLLATLVVAKLMFVLIERPAIRWARCQTSIGQALRSLK